uniref:von Willebrand factor type A domain-containing protein n=1 Tax=Trepomonas sp. PC1 TaxID=1076344 RepID=A0A146KCY6_9EUKA|eukprot:JAP94652.1 von Willebrand factor type A domain-containing protein [Trepomonas sp. PC1]
MMEVVAILDMSGSMGGIVNDTIGGFNTYLDQLKQSNMETLLTLVFFNNSNRTVYYRQNVKTVSHISNSEYRPMGGTALLDALGFSITRLRNELKNTPEDKKPGMVSFFVTTDGQENSSKTYNNQSIKKMVDQAQSEDKWEFVFAGAGIDAFAAGQNLGFYAHNIANIGNDGHSQNRIYNALAKQQCAAPSMKCKMSFQARFDSEK